MSRLRLLLRELFDSEVVRHPRYRAWERRHVRSAVQAGAGVLIVILVFDTFAMASVAIAEAALNIPLAIIAGIMLIALRRRSGPRRNPNGAAFVLGALVLTSSLLPIGLVPQAGAILIAYIPFVIIGSALFIPWNTSRHVAWLVVCVAMTLGFIVSPFSPGLDGRTADDLVVITVESVLVSFAGHVVLQRQRRSMFLQRLQVRGLNQLAAKQGRNLLALADELRAVARVDPLTGVANRLRLDEDLAGVARRALARDGGAALMVDIDWFKAYNDGHGHLAGDGVLRRVAAALTAQTRPSDRVYRYGGEEFLVLLPGASEREAAEIGERQRAAVASLAIPTNRARAARDEVVTVSLGVATIDVERDGASDPSSWLKAADDAMYASKLAGRNRVTVAGRAGPSLRDAVA